MTEGTESIISKMSDRHFIPPNPLKGALLQVLWLLKPPIGGLGLVSILIAR